MNAKELLEEYTSAEVELNVLAVEKQRLIDQVITPDIRDRLAEIDLEFQPRQETINQKRADVLDQLRYAVLQEGITVRGSTHMAVYTRPHAVWDTRMLDTLAMAMPDILAAKSESKPSVSVRIIA